VAECWARKTLRVLRRRGSAKFTCFTGTKGQILTERQLGPQDIESAECSVYLLYWYTKVQILTLLFLGTKQQRSTKKKKKQREPRDALGACSVLLTLLLTSPLTVTTAG
jgi:hypothetical protein